MYFLKKQDIKANIESPNQTLNRSFFESFFEKDLCLDRF